MDLEQKAIERIRMASEMSLHHYGLPLVCTYSGGKDSDVMMELFKRSGVPFEVVNSHTTADAPQTVYHIREVFRDLELRGIKCTIDYHVQPNGSRKTMWNLIPQNLMPPLRNTRYCCRILKEGTVKNRMIATGVRWAESRKRMGYPVMAPRGMENIKKVMMLDENDRRRALIERCEMRADMILNPILDWADSDIWDYYYRECEMHNPLYEMGYYRVGCIGCPMAGKNRWKEFADFPKYKDAYIRAFDRMLEVRKQKGKTNNRWKTGHDVFLWWMEDENIDGQMNIEDFIDV